MLDRTRAVPTAGWPSHRIRENDRRNLSGLRGGTSRHLRRQCFNLRHVKCGLPNALPRSRHRTRKLPPFVLQTGRSRLRQSTPLDGEGDGDLRKPSWNQPTSVRQDRRGRSAWRSPFESVASLQSCHPRFVQGARLSAASRPECATAKSSLATFSMNLRNATKVLLGCGDRHHDDHLPRPFFEFSSSGQRRTAASGEPGAGTSNSESI